MSNLFATTAIAAVLTFGATTAGAEAYVGASVGRSHENGHDPFTDQFLDLGFESAHSKTDDKDIGWRPFVGYGFGPYFAIEAAYADLGSFNSTTTVDPPGTFEARSEIKGYELDAVGRLPLGDRFSLYARAGAFRGKTTTNYSGFGSVMVFEDGAEQHKQATKATYALGAGYRITDHIGTRLEWARYNDMGDVLTGGQRDIDLVSLGVSYTF
jgi:OmpA-OmpF porin, OOP family